MLWFLVALLCLGEAAKPLLFKGLVKMSFCDAGVAIGDMRTCLKQCGKSRRNTFVSFSEDELQVSWQEQHFGEFHRFLRDSRST